jgi:NAD(P)-dependent dehydrogenase (short-subunit alcohol dehydrogenase family)
MADRARTVLITGTSSGIGKLTAEHFEARGWNVAATMRDPAKAEFKPSNRLRVFQLDVTKPDTIASAIGATIDTFGSIDALVNNAGYGLIGPFEAQTDEQMRRQFDTNVFGMMSVTRAVLPHMRKRGKGRIINVASMCGRMTLPLYTAYCATKWSVDGFSEALAFELNGQNIKVKIIEPGVFHTDFFTRSQEVARKDGLTDYDPYVRNVLPNIMTWEKAAPPAGKVAEAIYTAATDRWPRLRYTPGSTFTLAARRFVPSMLYMRAIKRLLNAW